MTVAIENRKPLIRPKRVSKRLISIINKTGPNFKKEQSNSQTLGSTNLLIQDFAQPYGLTFKHRQPRSIPSHSQVKKNRLPFQEIFVMRTQKKSIAEHHYATNPLITNNTVSDSTIANMFKHGIEVFGTQAGFNAWLDQTNFFFGYKTPRFYLSTQEGVNFIEARLTAMEYGDNV